MDFLKSLARGTLSMVFKLSLALLIILGPVVMVFGTPDQLKQSLRASKVYDTGVASIIDNMGKDTGGRSPQDNNQPEEDSLFNQQAVKDATKAALTPAFLQNTSEQIIDAMYGWLQGKTPEPQFSIDISPVKDRFTTAIGDYAVNRAKQLPACTLAQTRQLANEAEKIDPLSIPCVPPGYDIETLRAQIAGQLDKQSAESNAEKDNILRQSTLTQNSEFLKYKGSPTVFQRMSAENSYLPEIFQWLQRIPIITGLGAVVSGCLILLLYDDKRRGLRHLGIVLLSIGVLALLGIVLANAGFDKLEGSDALVNADANIKQPLINLVRALSDAFNKQLLVFGLTYAVLGGGILGGLFLTRPQNPSITNDNSAAKDGEAEPPQEDEEKTQEPSPGSEKKPKKPTKNIIQ